MIKHKPHTPDTAVSESISFNRLGAHLLRYFPLTQVQEILADYKEYLSLGRERGDSVDSLLEELRHPAGIAGELLKETPKRICYFGLWTGGWGVLTLITFYLCRRSLPSFTVPITGLLPLMSILTLSLFALLHGRARAVLERQFGSVPLGKSYWLLQLLPVILTVLTEYAMQYLLVLHPETVPAFIGPWHIGQTADTILCLFLFLLTILLIWTLLQIHMRSILYYPGAVHALGAILFLLDIRALLHNMDLSASDYQTIRQVLLFSLAWYGTGLLLSLIFTLYLRASLRQNSREVR